MIKYDVDDNGGNLTVVTEDEMDVPVEIAGLIASLLKAEETALIRALAILCISSAERWKVQDESLYDTFPKLKTIINSIGLVEEPSGMCS